MPVTASDSTSAIRDEPHRRGRRAMWWLGGVGAVSAVFAALVVFSSSTRTSPPSDPVAHVSATSEVLTVGPPDAPVKVVVREDFGSPSSRSFETSSRDFLRDVAAQGDLVVEYHPAVAVDDAYSARAARVWGVVADRGSPAQALALHDLLFDQQPAADKTTAPGLIALAQQAGVEDDALLDAVAAAERAPATGVEGGAPGVRTTPSVLVDGRPLTGSSPVALADRLQRLVLERTGAS